MPFYKYIMSYLYTHITFCKALAKGGLARRLIFQPLKYRRFQHAIKLITSSQPVFLKRFFLLEGRVTHTSASFSLVFLGLFPENGKLVV